jgi:hypothetical protein
MVASFWLGANTVFDCVFWHFSTFPFSVMMDVRTSYFPISESLYSRKLVDFCWKLFLFMIASCRLRENIVIGLYFSSLFSVPLWWMSLFFLFHFRIPVFAEIDGFLLLNYQMHSFLPVPL